MIRYKSILWITFILLGWIFLKNHQESRRQPAIPAHEQLKEHTWLHVAEDTGQAAGRHIIRELRFTGKNQFEIIETFKFSGSTFRNPGQYSMTDSLIRLKSSNGKVHIANLRKQKDGRLRVEWLRPRLIHGQGSEIYQTLENKKKQKQIVFSSRLLEFLKPGR